MPEEIEVPTEHLHEKMEEAAEERGGWVKKVAVSSALLAVTAAISALYAGHHANEAMLEEMKATDSWAQYQAKGIKLAVTQSKIDTLAALGKEVSSEEKDKPKHYEEDQKKIEEEGHEFEKSSAEHMTRHVSFARAVTIFQIAIALGAIAVLASLPILWLFSLGGFVAGLVFLILGFM